jgi:hypothetical protein
MDSTVKVRPNHYELLGLTPAATLDEIDQAFARELRLPRAFGSLAEFTVAYETLRDPAKRKAYDASIFKPEPKPEPRPALSLAGRLEGAALSAAPPKPVVRPRLRPDPRPQARTAPSATALLHQPIAPRIPQRDPTPQAKQEPLRRPEPPARPQPEQHPINDYAPRPLAGDYGDPERHAPFQWKLPALATGALVLAISGGAWMGVESGNDAPEDQLKPAVTLKVPPAKAAAPVAASADEPRTIAAEQPSRPTRSAAPAESARPPLQIDLPDEQPTEVAALEQQQRDIEQAAAPATAATVTEAKMPLPNSVIARTIGRIGYPCGQVASTAALDGAGVFKVTCTSGHAYRAAPVNGRYRFKRMGKS